MGDRGKQGRGGSWGQSHHSWEEVVGEGQGEEDRLCARDGLLRAGRGPRSWSPGFFFPWFMPFHKVEITTPTKMS